MSQSGTSPARTILFSGFIAGTLDITAAIVILAKMKAARVFMHIASGAFGKTAFSSGPLMIFFGIFFHYLIAMTIATIYFFIYPRLPFLKTNKYLSAILIGTGAWAFMNLVVVPLSQIGPVKFDFVGVLKNMLILIVCIGLPISIFTSNYYNRTTNLS